jgi:D-alanyl-D-alanine carboxypeptidase/D-alanyl-D-alanine-endopeptidase (penicillin-binding protein 4)
MRTLLFFISVLSLSSCSVSHYLNREIKNSSVLSQQHTGISISNLNDSKTLASYQGNRYFTPASNTKLFSFYAGLCALGDSVPGLEYLEWGELLIIRGTGDPSLITPRPSLQQSFRFSEKPQRPDLLHTIPFREQAFWLRLGLERLQRLLPG